jgi:hypothetical protein
MGGLQNFLKQHKPGISKACQLNLQKKNSMSAYHKLQPCLELFFTKEPKALIPPTILTPLYVVAYAIELTSSKPSVMEPTSSRPTCVPDMLVNNLLTRLENAIAKLPNLPETSKMHELAAFT